MQWDNPVPITCGAPGRRRSSPLVDPMWYPQIAYILRIHMVPLSFHLGLPFILFASEFPDLRLAVSANWKFFFHAGLMLRVPTGEPERAAEKVQIETETQN